MLSVLPPAVAGLLALVAVAVLPGMLLVRAPWTVVPALSVAFWTLSWWWVPAASRTRAVELVLAVFAVLALLRLLPRHVVPPPPDYDGPLPSPPVTGPTTADVPRLRSAPALGVVAVAFALQAPVALLHHVPGREMAFHTTATRAAVWRDALPRSYEPLLPVGPFGAHAPGLATLAADIALVSGLPPGRAVALATLASVALLLLGLFALLAAWLRPRAAGLAALLGLAVLRWPGFFATWGEGGPILALALGVAAAALLLGHTSRPSAVAAGMLLAAASLAQPLLALLIGVGVGVAVRLGAQRSLRAQGEMTKRVALALAVMVALAAPALWRLVCSVSAGEAWAAVRALEGGQVVDFLMGMALLVLVALLATRLAGSGMRATILATAGAVLLLVRVTLGLGVGQIPPASLHHLAVLEREGRPLEAVCAPEAVIGWVPALAGRPPGRNGPGGPEPWIPHCLREEWRRRPGRPCVRLLE